MSHLVSSFHASCAEDGRIKVHVTCPGIGPYIDVRKAIDQVPVLSVAEDEVRMGSELSFYIETAQAAIARSALQSLGLTIQRGAISAEQPNAFVEMFFCPCEAVQAIYSWFKPSSP